MAVRTEPLNSANALKNLLGKNEVKGKEVGGNVVNQEGSGQ